MNRLTTRRELLRRARGGNARDQFELAQHYDLVPPKDRGRARFWYRKAAQQGHSVAQNNLGELLRDVMNGRREMLHWFRKAAEQGESNAQLSLGYALFYGKGIR